MMISPDNLPTPKQENWKYTNLPKAVPDGLTRATDEAEIVIHKNRGQTGGQIEDILFTGRDGLLHSPVLKVILEEGAELTLIERHEGSGAYWKNMKVEITLGANAKLHHYRIIEDESVVTRRTRLRRYLSGIQSRGSIFSSAAMVASKRACWSTELGWGIR